jgi:glycosyltransferase involved in cell wall biosynthesis
MAPLVSIFLCVKNGMPFLPEALASVAAQSYRDFELVVQDGGSTDGTLEAIRGIENIPSVSIVTEPDSGVGDARQRALRRCRGEIVGSIDADNLLSPDAISSVVQVHTEHPECAAVYGSANLVDQYGKLLSCFQPASFDQISLMRCELVPPFASSFFFKKVCGADLHFDTSLENCEDFDLWLRISHLPILRSEIVFNSTRLSPKSMSQNSDRYETFCRNKIRVLENYFRRYGDGTLMQSLLKSSMAGVYLWAAESIYGIEGESARFNDFCERAATLDPTSTRLENLKRKVEYETVKAEYERIRAELQRAQSDLQTTRLEFAMLRARFEAIENSKGWKLVQRYRTLRDRLKGLFRRSNVTRGRDHAGNSKQ